MKNGVTSLERSRKLKNLSGGIPFPDEWGEISLQDPFYKAFVPNKFWCEKVLSALGFRPYALGESPRGGFVTLYCVVEKVSEDIFGAPLQYGEVIIPISIFEHCWSLREFTYWKVHEVFKDVRGPDWWLSLEAPVLENGIPQFGTPMKFLIYVSLFYLTHYTMVEQWDIVEELWCDLPGFFEMCPWNRDRW